MLTRILVILCVILLASVHATSHALGLGEMVTRSAISEALDADIALLSTDNVELDRVKVRLADAVDFQAAGVERLPVLKRLKFQVMSRTQGEAVIRVSSDLPVNEPFLNFIIEVDWPNGRLLREYTALLDPPVTTERKAPKITPPSSRIKLTPIQATPSVVSSARPITRTDEYGPVKPKETLWSIAGRVRPDGVSMQQMMAALQQANPQAFIGGNMNRLRKGQILRVPDLDAILKISPAQAAAMFRQQLNAWIGESNEASNIRVATQNTRKNVPEPATNKATPKAEATVDSGQDTASTASPVAETPPQPPGRLQIAAPRPDADGEAGASEGRGDIQSNYELTEQLMRARENAETARQEANILRGEIDDLQSRLSDMQRLLTLKDEQLAQLQDTVQQRSQETGISTPDPKNGQSTNQPNAPQPDDNDQQMVPPDDGQTLINQDTAVQMSEVDPAEPPLPGLSEEDQAKKPDEVTAVVERTADENNWITEARAVASNVWQTASAQPLYMAGLAGGLFLLLIFLIIRRKRNEAAVEEIAQRDPFDTGYEASSAPMSDLIGDDDNDPANQADLHIAYGRFQQAEEVLRQAEQEFPQRMDIQHKLLEVYHATGNAEAFAATAQRLVNANQHLNNPDIWAEVVAMGSELDPANPLFNPVLDTPNNASGDNPIEFELDQEGFAANQSSTTRGNSKSTSTSGMQPPLDEPLDIEQAFQSVINENTNPVQMELEPENEDVKNKIDLARVYIDMGDADGARDILQEVQAEGSERQKNQATELIAQLASR